MTNLEKIKEIRERSGVSLGACMQALDKVGGDVEKALVELQKQGLLRAAKNKSDAKEGCIYSYTHSDSKLVAVVEVNCQTDFCARSEEFREFAEQCSLQVASMAPKYLSSGDVPDDVLESQRDIFKSQTYNLSNDINDHIVNGKMRKWFSEVCLMDQKSVVVPGGITMEQLRANLVMKTGENIVVRRFLRWKIGE